MSSKILKRKLAAPQLPPKCVCSHQRAVLHVLSQQPVVVQRVLGFSCHGVHRPFVHLVLYCSKQHVERLPCRFLVKQKEEGRSAMS